MTTAAIRDTIELAKLHEKQHGHLAQLFEKQVLENIHMAIQLPEEGAVESLVEFVISYVEHVPNFIDATRAITQAANIHEHAETYLKIAEDYFLKPPEIVKGHVGLDELMDEAYLAHRLMEEVNDRFMIRSSIPLIPMDMTMSNLIVHNLIGEPFANELDDYMSNSSNNMAASKLGSFAIHKVRRSTPICISPLISLSSTHVRQYRTGKALSLEMLQLSPVSHSFFAPYGSMCCSFAFHY